jgi:dTDP-4-amino-4,6-dideoxygalactose transaminase
MCLKSLKHIVTTMYDYSDGELINKFNGNYLLAVMPNNFTGIPLDVRYIRDLILEGSSILIDGAHSFGAEYNNIKAGSEEEIDMMTLSFHPTKHITTGEGGAIITNDPFTYDELIAMRNNGLFKVFDEYKHMDFSSNYHMSDINAALGIAQIKRIDDIIARHHEIMELYRKYITTKYISFQDIPYNVKSAYHLCRITIDESIDLPQFKQYLDEYNIGYQQHYKPCFKFDTVKRKSTCCFIDENAIVKNYELSLSLPLFFGLTNDLIWYIINTINEYFKGD